jgi:hypothetical protein
MQREQKIALGEMRESGPTRLIVYCADYKCGHSIVVDASRWSDDCQSALEWDPISASKRDSDAVLVQLHSILRQLVWPEADRFCRGRTFAV